MSDTEVMAIEATNGAKRGRGRPKKDPNAPKPVKHMANNGITDGTNGNDDGEMKKRGRQAKAKAPAPAPAPAKSGPSGAKRGRGRPKKSEATGAKRGRKPGKKAAQSEGSADEDSPPMDSNEDEGHEEEED